MFDAIGNHLTFRPQHGDDRAFLRSLYASTREDELNLCAMTPAEKRVFIRRQFELKENDYARRFKDAKFMIVCRKKKSIGRVVYRTDDPVHLIDIALAKKSRSQGYGRAIIGALIAYAKQRGRRFELSVAAENVRALKLYRTMGFQTLGLEGFYFKMQIQ